MSLFHLGGVQAFDTNGAPVSGAKWWFYLTGTSTPAAVYADSDLATSLGTSVTANASGTFVPIYLDDSIIYRAVLKTAAGATIRGMDVDPVNGDDSSSQIVSVLDYGAVGDNVTDDGPAFAAAIAYLKTLANVAGFGYGRASGALFVPAGVYYLGTTTLDITHTMKIYGEGSGLTGAGSSVLRWAAGATGIRTQAYNTTGATATRTPEANNVTGSGTIIEGLFLKGGYAGAGVEAEEHGIHLRAMALVRDCYISHFRGDGIYALAAAGGGAPTEGNVNLSRIENVTIEHCRNGIFFDNADSNSCTVISANCSSNRQWGIYDSSFLGNTYVGCHVAANGWDGANGSIPTGSTIGGSRYYVKAGQAVGASTNGPKNLVVTITIASPGVVTWASHGLANGTSVTFSTTGALPTGLVANTVYYVVNAGANDFQVSATYGGAAINTSGSQSGVHTSGAGVDNTWWGYTGPGGTYGGIVAWVSGTTFREGGAYKTDDVSARNVFVGCYSETDQNSSQMVTPTLVIGGLQAAGVAGEPGVIDAYGNMVASKQGFKAYDALSQYASLAPNELKFYHLTNGEYGWEWVTGDLVWTANGSGSSADWAFKLTGTATTSALGAKKMDFPNGYGLAGKKVLSGTAAPVAGTYAVGDTVWNSAPAAGGVPGWMCTTAGTPGTWKAMAALAA